MGKKRAAFVLLSATASTLVAAADPAPKTDASGGNGAVKPRTLKSGAPACGNLVNGMSYKSMAAPAPAGCTAVKAILTSIDEGIREARETVAIFDLVGRDRSSSLTLAVEGRPRS